MTRDELKQLMQGVIPAVPTPFDEDFHVDHGRMAAATQYWIENGLVTGKGVIKVAAMIGEGPQLRDEEWPALLRTTVQAARGRVPVTCGIHHKDTLRTIEDAKRAQDLGAVGLQISPPIFNDPTQEDILRYYEAVSDAIDIGILVYNNWWMRGGAIFPDTILRMADFEHVVAIKWQAPTESEFKEMKRFSSIFNVIDNSREKPSVLCHQLGGRGFITSVAAAYPPHALKVWELLESKRYDEAQSIVDRVDTPLKQFTARVNQRSGSQARVPKAAMIIMGQPMGAPRPPSLPLNEEEMAELRDLLASFGWPVAA